MTVQRAPFAFHISQRSRLGRFDSLVTATWLATVPCVWSARSRCQNVKGSYGQHLSRDWLNWSLLVLRVFCVRESVKKNWSVTFTVVKHYLPEVDWQRSCSMLDPCQIEFAVRVALWPVVWTVASVDYHLSYLTLIWRHSNLVFSVFLTRARHSACLTQTLLYPLTSSGWLGAARCLLGFIIDHLATVQMPKRCDLTLFVECREVERKETNETMLVGNKNAPRGIVNVVNQNSLTEYP